MAIFLSSCVYPLDKVIYSLGEYDDYVFYTSGGFQDYTDYAKYYFSSAQTADNKYLKRIRDDDRTVINTHLDDFENWIETIRNTEETNEVVVHYDFDRSIIDTEDYFYIVSEEDAWEDGSTFFVKYNVYFLDMQTGVLYYFHNNI